MNLPPTDAIMEQFKFEGADCWEYDVDKCMQAYGQLCRNAALEEAAQEFEGVEHIAWKHDDFDHAVFQKDCPKYPTDGWYKLFTRPLPAQDVNATKPNCKECAKWVQEQADNKEWQEGVKRGNEIVAALAAAKQKELK